MAQSYKGPRDPKSQSLKDMHLVHLATTDKQRRGGEESERIFLKTLMQTKQKQEINKNTLTTHATKLADQALLDMQALWYWIKNPVEVYLPARRDLKLRNRFVTPNGIVLHVPDKDLVSLLEVENPMNVLEADTTGELLAAQV